MVGHQVLVLRIEVRALVPQLAKNAPQIGCIFLRAGVSKVWDTLRQGLDAVQRYWSCNDQYLRK